ncbi:MAG: ABC transporter ATP-binding protein/permease [Clostridia bacterium]|nr:ABC transporter ATP-binding protein/permease [Clostridia bacterium]
MFKVVKDYIGKYLKYAIIGPVAIGLEVLLEVYMPYKTAEIINVSYGNGDKRYIVAIGLYVLILTIVSLIFGALSGWASSVAAVGLGKNVRTALFEKVNKFSFANTDKFSTSSLITRLTVDVNNVQNSFMMILRAFVRSPLMLIAATIMAFKINKHVAVVYLISIPALAIGLTAVSVCAFPKFQKMLKKYDTMNRDIQENLIGIRAVKAYVREDYETNKFFKTSEEVKNAQVGAEKIIALNGPIMQFIVGVTIGSVLYFGGEQIVLGNMGPGDLFTLVTYGMQILMSIMMLSMILVMVVISKASVTRINEVLDEEIDIVEKTDNKTKELKVQNGDIEFKNVYFKYNEIINLELESEKDDKPKKKKLSALDKFQQAADDFKKAISNLTSQKNKSVEAENYTLSNINFKIKSGETVGIIGATGSGKTSLINLIPRLYDANKGKVLVGGVDVKDYSLKNLRDAVAIVLQKNELFSGTISENLRWGKEDATHQEIVDACKIADANDFIMSFPNGYETELGQGGVNVSGGQKQRLTIARALLKDPKILILDDSMSAVDTKTDKNIRKGLKSFRPDITKIIIAQRISSISDADKIIVMNNGLIDQIGTHDELLKTNDIYKEIFNSQKNGGKQ